MNENTLIYQAPDDEQFIKEKQYWLAKFSGELNYSYFPYDCLKTNLEPKNERVEFQIGDELALKLMKLSNDSDVKLHMILVAGLAGLLHKYTGNNDVTVGTPIYKQEIEGDFINTLLGIRSVVNPEATFKELLLHTRTNIMEAVEHQNYPIDSLLQQLNIPLQANANFPLFDSIILLENIHDYNYIKDVKVGVVFNFKKGALAQNHKLEAFIEYNSHLYHRATIERIMEHFQNFLLQVLDDVNMPIGEAEIITTAEKTKLLRDFNSTTTAYSKDKTIQEIFEEQVAQKPNKIAASFYEAETDTTRELTYEELNRRANQLARVLIAKGVKPDNIVGIMVDRSLEQIIGIMAILKAGGAYLPIDPDYPTSRIQFMVEDSKIQIILSQTHLLERVRFKGELIAIDHADLYQGESANTHGASQPENLAYLIYTSGSTGMPKGVMVEHTGVANLKTFFAKHLGVTTDDQIVQFAPISFDASVWEMFMSLLNGATLHLLSRDIINDPLKFEDFLNRRQITVATLPPPYLANLNPKNIHTLQTIVAAGSASSPELVNRWSQKVNYINAYGPTETTVCATFWKANPAEMDNNMAPIGRPITNTQVYVLDEDGGLVPIGNPGEICVGGAGLARGYLGKSDLTKTKFVDNPFHPGEKIYRTGDLGRWRPDGNIEFLGRLDQQVKLRGFRIELGEIEFQLQSYPGIKEALVIAKENENGDGYLVAYMVADAVCEPAQLKEYLSNQLPEYMIPAYFVMLEKMPLNHNGKINLEALPAPTNKPENRYYEKPQSELQEKILKIWQDVLRVDQLGINDNFFENGGDSIKAIQVSSRLNSYQLQMDIKDLFNYPNIKALSNHIKVDVKTVEQGAVVGEVLMIPIYHWFFETIHTDQRHFNQSILLYNREGLDQTKLNEVFTCLVEHHDALRMIFREENHRITCYNRDFHREMVSFQVADFTSLADPQAEIEAEINRIQGSLSLSDGILFRATLMKTRQGDHLLIVIHHLVIDGVSWRVLCEDLAVGYQQAARQEAIKLLNKTNSFKDWALQLNEYARDKKLLNEIPYWKKVEDTRCKPLPKDQLTGQNRFQDSKNLDLLFTEDETQKLLTQVHHAYNTGINDILLTGLGLALKEWAQNDNIPVFIEGHGREPIISDINLSRTVGWFTSMYPIVLDMANGEDLSYQIKAIKEYLRRIPNGGIGYGILKYLTPSEAKAGLEFKLNPEISFNYLGQFDRDFNSEVFSVSPLSTGLNISPNVERPFVLEISGIVYGARLRLIINYNQYEYDEATIHRLLNRYQDYLRQIIKHCMAKGETELTPADLGDSELSLEELEAITDLY